MAETDLSLHFAVLSNLESGTFTALKPTKMERIHFDALDVTLSEGELGHRLFRGTSWNSRGRRQLQATIGLAQLIDDNPIYSAFTETTLPEYLGAMNELSDHPDAMRQLKELLLEDIKEIAVDSKVIGIEALAQEKISLEKKKRTYWDEKKWEIGWAFYKSLDKAQDIFHLATIDIPTTLIRVPSNPDFREVPLEPLPFDKKVAVVIKIWFGTNRERVANPRSPGETFNNRRDPEPGVKLHYGLARVSIPKRYNEGKIDRPKWWKLEFCEDEERHFILKKVDVLDETVWVKAASAPESEGVVFVHGFNVSFEDAMYTTAQLARDLKYEGPVFCFSWASCGASKPLDYTADEATIGWSEDHLAEFFRTITNQLGLKRLHVIAHSMGNRAVLGVLTRWVQETNVTPLSQLVLAAPDVDSGTFANRRAHFSKCERVTLYASRADRAIVFSRKIHKNPRVGDANPPLVVGGVDTIDATVAGEDVLGLGHSYFAQKSKIFSDLFYVITQRMIPAASRVFLQPHIPPGYYELL
jgi:esterase/lipase superfamily enzyme